jgi:hypothetical protein
MAPSILVHHKFLEMKNVILHNFFRYSLRYENKVITA